MDYISTFRIEMSLLEQKVLIYVNNSEQPSTVNDIVKLAEKSRDDATNAINIIESIRRQITNQSPSLTFQLNHMRGVEGPLSACDWTFHLTEEWVTKPLASIQRALCPTTPPSTAAGRENDQHSLKEPWSFDEQSA